MLTEAVRQVKMPVNTVLNNYHLGFLLRAFKGDH